MIYNGLAKNDVSDLCTKLAQTTGSSFVFSSIKIANNWQDHQAGSLWAKGQADQTHTILGLIDQNNYTFNGKFCPNNDNIARCSADWLQELRKDKFLFQCVRKKKLWITPIVNNVHLVPGVYYINNGTRVRYKIEQKINQNKPIDPLRLRHLLDCVCLQTYKHALEKALDQVNADLNAITSLIN